MKTFFIAEIGVNHFGSYEKALRMIGQAKVCGAQAVKFQKYDPIRVLGKDSPHLKDAHQLSWKELTDLSKEAHNLGLQFGCSVFNPQDVAITDRISDYHKIATRMNRNAEFIAVIERCKKPTYMSVQPELGIRIPERFRLLWCIAGKYPSTKEEVLKYPYLNVGLSSHCPDWTSSLEAIKRGAKWVENHVCESKDEIGCDISSSLDFSDYEKLINNASTLAA
jgi:sialic acid synthase SpsE